MKYTGLLIAMLCLPGCFFGHKEPGAGADRLTVGHVQGEIKQGMPASDVAAILGSPNIVTTDEKRREVWIYDKVSTDRVNTRKSAAGGLILVFGLSTTQSESTTVQRTMTVIIKFDEENKVRDFAYNYTQF
ncbi:MAG: hypothetical protein ACOC95_03950 [Planctomycetota bacterium]